MAAFNDLLRRVTDATLRGQLEEEYRRALRNKKFGLVFEEHRPEFTALHGVGLKEGMSVVVNGLKTADVLQVVSLAKGMARCHNPSSGEMEEHPISDLVAVARFEDPVFPVLTSVDEVENAPGDPLWHTLIQADNYHALQLLEYMYRGKVDCIYIDPPYNTGAHDWKYNNDFVDESDSWRHSKWLSMMEKRLRLAKGLLNPKDSVLIVTIDEKEYLHLGMLLEEMFPEARIQMVSSVINNGGSMRSKEFTRVDEYLFFVMIGGSGPDQLPLGREWLGTVKHTTTEKLRWRELIRYGDNGKRRSRPNLFYPIFVTEDGERFIGVGQPLPFDKSIGDIEVPQGAVPVWPIRPNGEEGTWGYDGEGLLNLQKKGYVKLGRFNKNSMAITFIQPGWQRKLESGEIQVTGFAKDGSVIESNEGYIAKYSPRTQWAISTHSASEYGTKLIQGIVGNRFSFPKSLYAVHDAIRFFVANKPDALILDFFAGSGTTLHAVNLLNAEDGGRRRCIMVTNNEVSEAEAKVLRTKGLKPGDEEWEALGIARHVAWPRTVCSIEGHNIKGEPLKGEYIGSELTMADGFKANAKFFRLDFADKDSVRLGRQFKGILPILWMRSGAKGKCPSWDRAGEPDMLVLPENGFAVLVDYDKYARFIAAVNTEPRIADVYFVTNSEADYREMCTGLVRGKRATHLYHSYLENFVIGCRRNAK